MHPISLAQFIAMVGNVDVGDGTHRSRNEDAKGSAAETSKVVVVIRWYLERRLAGMYVLTKLVVSSDALSVRKKSRLDQYCLGSWLPNLWISFLRSLRCYLDGLTQYVLSVGRSPLGEFGWPGT